MPRRCSSSLYNISHEKAYVFFKLHWQFSFTQVSWGKLQVRRLLREVFVSLFFSLCDLLAVFYYSIVTPRSCMFFFLFCVCFKSFFIVKFVVNYICFRFLSFSFFSLFFHDWFHNTYVFFSFNIYIIFFFNLVCIMHYFQLI